VSTEFTGCVWRLRRSSSSPLFRHAWFLRFLLHGCRHKPATGIRHTRCRPPAGDPRRPAGRHACRPRVGLVLSVAFLDLAYAVAQHLVLVREGGHLRAQRICNFVAGQPVCGARGWWPCRGWPLSMISMAKAPSMSAMSPKMAQYAVASGPRIGPPVPMNAVPCGSV
jgi:hypothetical protein